MRVLLIDDSSVIRTLVSSWIEQETDLTLAGVAADGAEAVDLVGRTQADVCILDLEMPVLSGLEALPRMLRLRPDLKVLVVSRLTSVGADASLRALEAGAVDCLRKPSSSEREGTNAFRRELMTRLRMLGRNGAGLATCRPADRPAQLRGPARLRPLPARLHAIEALVVASSTGGPAALRLFLEGLTPDLHAPVLAVQHMPPAFIELLAVQLSKTSPLPVAVASHGEAVERGKVYLAPGDHHLRLVREGGQLRAVIDQGPQENYCRPAADVLFRTAAEACGAGALAVVLTGMGRDGCSGGQAIVSAGGVVLAQDEASSVVWGMPGAVVEAGLASVVGKVERLAAAVSALAAGRRP